ncbi:MAG: helix-turn-helix domain-containing protein [Neptuniibacter sp.]
MSLAVRLRELRADKEASLQTVADAIGVSKPHVWELEKGKTKNPSLDLLKKLADYYEVTLDYLAGVSNQSDDPRYNALLRKIDPENLSDLDWEIIEDAVNMAVKVLNKGKQDKDDQS